MTIKAEPATEPTAAPVRDDLAYMLPMALFLVLTWVGGTWPTLYPASYVVKTILAGAALLYCRRAYTPIRWDFWWLGVLIGVLGLFQWIGMQLWLQEHVAHFRPDPASPPFDPTKAFDSPLAMNAFVVFRWVIGASIIVPFMEELFWRDFVWRSVIAPSNFKLATIGEWSVKTFLVVAIAFAFVHGNWWLTSIVWALMIGGLLAYTKSLGACILAHAVTNFLLGAYVLLTRDWGFW